MLRLSDLCLHNAAFFEGLKDPTPGQGRELSSQGHAYLQLLGKFILIEALTTESSVETECDPLLPACIVLALLVSQL